MESLHTTQISFLESISQGQLIQEAKTMCDNISNEENNIIVDTFMKLGKLRCKILASHFYKTNVYK